MKTNIKTESIFLRARGEIKKLQDISFQSSTLERNHFANLTKEDRLELLKFYFAYKHDIRAIADNLDELQKEWEALK